MSDSPVRRGIRSAQIGLVVNTLLAGVKLVAGIVGNAYALVADAVESTADILSSLIVWGGLRVAERDPDDSYHFGYAKAEVLAATTVALMLVGAAVAIAVESVQEIRTPHRVPAAWTLGVLVAVVVIKWVLARRVGAVGAAIGSTAVQADAFHHLSDAITSSAAFAGILVAVVGWRATGDIRWAQADDWAALLAAGVIFYNGVLMLRPTLADLMDRSPGEQVAAAIRRAAGDVPGVLATEKLGIRKAGMVIFVDIHVQADPRMSLHDAHELGHAVKAAIEREVETVRGVLVHMEPFRIP
jgi:cation diffusion facilitator family transporter